MFKNEICGLAYPDGEGPFGPGRTIAVSGRELAQVPVSWQVADTSWHRIRIQVFPDGTCGFAIDGVPRHHSTAKIPLDTPYLLLLRGNSVETRIMVGPIDVWKGVKDDIAWSRLP